MAMISQVQPFLLLLLISFFVLPALALPYQNCSSLVKYPVKVKTVRISPYPVIRNHNANLSIIAIATKKIPKGATVAVYNLFETHTRLHSLCKVTACPVKPGRFVLNFSNIFAQPSTIVDVFNINVRIYNKDVEAPLMCILFGGKRVDKKKIIG